MILLHVAFCLMLFPQIYWEAEFKQNQVLRHTGNFLLKYIFIRHLVRCFSSLVINIDFMSLNKLNSY